MDTVIGIDVGQKRDPTAVCVAQRESRDEDGRAYTHYLIRHLERLPLGTPYPQVAERIGQIATGVKERTGYPPSLFIDATGVGQPVVDAVSQGRHELGQVTGVYFTHGDRVSEIQSGPRYIGLSLGKSLLVSNLKVLLQNQRIHLPQTSEARALAQELVNYEIRIDEDANERYGAFRTGTHDDLVTALGLTLDYQTRRPFLGWDR